MVWTDNYFYPNLLYSNFTNKKEDAKEATIHIDKFRNDLKILVNSGYNIISLSDVALTIERGARIPEQSICLVLFGGYRSHYDLAFPILKELNIHADLFVATDLMGLYEYPGLSSFAPHFSWSEADEMKRSGLVDIYAMWHPFDENKDMNFEVANKLEQIKRNVPGSNPETAFCIKLDGNVEEKQSVLDRVGIKFNLVYYWSFKASQNKRELPYITVNQESSVIDVVEHFHTKMNEQSKLDTDLELIDSICCDWTPKIEGKILPINTTPRVRNLLRHAIPLSVIGAVRQDRADLIVINNYIEIVSRPWYHFFDYDNHMYINWPELSCCRLAKDLIRASETNVADLILYGLKAGYYADVWTDEYYIPGKWGYRNRHLAHNVLIYGYDSGSDVFLCMSYTQGGHYATFNLKPDDLLRSCLSEYFDSIQLIKNNPDCQVTYDIRILAEKLKRYINSEYEFANNTKCTSYDQNQFVNFKACVQFSQYIEDVAENENTIYSVCFYSYIEHKKCMGWRLNYIAQREGWTDSFFEEFYNYTEKTTEKLLKLCMKFNVTGNKAIVSRITRQINELNDRELKAIQTMLEFIT